MPLAIEAKRPIWKTTSQSARGLLAEGGNRHSQIAASKIRYVDERIKMADYDGEPRQIKRMWIRRDNPTLFLTNNFDVPARQLITNHARRNGIEDVLGNSVNLFHLDCLSSEVRLMWI